jgi:hypothetical protein
VTRGRLIDRSISHTCSAIEYSADSPGVDRAGATVPGRSRPARTGVPDGLHLSAWYTGRACRSSRGRFHVVHRSTGPEAPRV